MEPTDEVFMELVRQLRSAAQLRHSWTARVFQAQRELHPAAAWLLAELARRGESRMSVLAKERMVDLSVISRQVAQLSDAGLVERRPAPDDGRASLVRVSERGHAELDGWRSGQLDLLRQALGGWAAEDLADVTARLREINHDLREFMGVQNEDCAAHRPRPGPGTPPDTRAQQVQGQETQRQEAQTSENGTRHELSLGK
ncbi:MarR family transcriptional regulator [Amycolatopsis antarctica]|uniref:MarR family transcriptional regulator n=1 Tax=Amycolatopsis antarctica TaxID=1854586 RepID=A0A263CZ20_9PSEU|nr:MarR family transcriptional regulator [Amycolatopsis antarctica]